MTRQDYKMAALEIGGALPGAWLFFAWCYPVAEMTLLQNLPWILGVAVSGHFSSHAAVWLASLARKQTAHQVVHTEPSRDWPVAPVGGEHSDSEND